MGSRTLSGVVGAVVAGLVLGVMMQRMGMLETLAGMVGMERVAVGWVIHLMVSALFGLVYGLVLMTVSEKVVGNLGLGAAYGIAIWIIGPMIVMPVMVSGGVMAIDGESLMALVGHVVWGVLTGAIAAGLQGRVWTAGSGSARQPA